MLDGLALVRRWRGVSLPPLARVLELLMITRPRLEVREHPDGRLIVGRWSDEESRFIELNAEGSPPVGDLTLPVTGADCPERS